MGGLGGGLGSFVGGDSAVTEPTVNNEAARGLLVSLMPPGELYDFDNPDADIYKMFYAFGQSAKFFGYDVADRLHVEFNPAQCLEKLGDWESALNILPGTGNASAGKTTDQRRQGIVSKLRESGASTLSNIRAALGPVLGYVDPSQLEVLEVSRADLRTAHTLSDTTSHNIPSGNSYTYSFVVSDDNLPLGGVQAFVIADTGTRVTVTIASPSGTSKAISATADIITGQYFYAASEFAGDTVTGTWTVTVDKTGGGSVTVTQVDLFVEGLGLSGLGGDIFYWGVYADPGLVNSPDYTAARASITRLNPAHCQGFLVLSEDPWPDVETGIHLAIPDEAIPV
jgi:uncharacterized protein YmfQ (DUF2313 family)